MPSVFPSVVFGVLSISLIFGPVQASSAERRPGEAAAVKPLAFRPLPLGKIKPTGWLREQLRIQASGLSGHLDEFWPDIKNSAWTGGTAEGWERLPYWLDGIVPLAFLLDDPALQAKAKRVIDFILEHQRPDGWLGPVGDSVGHRPYDPWPLFPLFKALIQYQEATGDARIIPAIKRCAGKIGQVMEKTPLDSWAKMRAADLAVTMLWAYFHTGEEWPLDLARKAFAQSHDWRHQFEHFRFTEKTLSKFNLDTHGVNTAMGLKYGAVRFPLTGAAADRNAAFTMLRQLDLHHGQATGIFTCDEHLAGRSPSQGTELCTVVEAMYSLELLCAVTGDPRFADRLEKLAFNALPATFKKDMTAHQYDQQSNQVRCAREGEHVYVNNGPDSNLFGLEPNFGCCTANMHQGWPKFTSALWMRGPDDGLAVVAYAPCVVETSVRGEPVKVEVETAYPFRDHIEITVTAAEPVSFPMRLRTPGWAREIEITAPGLSLGRSGAPLGPGPTAVKVNEDGGYLDLTGEWTGQKKISLRLPMHVEIYKGFHDSAAILRGPLVYALKVGAEWKKVKDNPRFADWEVYPTTPWNYALAIDRDHPARSLSVEERPLGPSPFSPEGAPVIARIKGRRLPGWKLEKGAAAPPPQSPVASDAPLEELTLIPYGCTDLRITEFPVLSNSH